MNDKILTQEEFEANQSVARNAASNGYEVRKAAEEANENAYADLLARVREQDRLLSEDYSSVEPCAHGKAYELRRVERASFRNPSIVVNHAGIVAAFMSPEEAASFVEQSERVRELEAATLSKAELLGLRGFLINNAQLLQGWHADGTHWTEWDESIRQENDKWLARLYAITTPLPPLPRLDRPIPATGKLSLWNLPDELLLKR